VTDNVLPDPGTPFGERVARRLRDEKLIWLTTVGVDGTPQPNPVWFLADGSTVLVYNQVIARRLRHIQRNPRVSLNFDSAANGDDVVILTGRAHVVENHPLAHENPVYMDKYGASAIAISGDVEGFSREYPIAVHITIERVRGF
jgi:PPOX class probable F420-dependent enzyme